MKINLDWFKILSFGKELKSYFCFCFVCLGFYAVSTLFKFFNSDSSQIHVSWTIFNQYLTSPLSWHWRASCSVIPIILSAKGENHFYQF